MSRLHNRRGSLSVALMGCLCCIGSGCGQGAGDEFRTYEQTIADVTPGEVSTDTEPVSIEAEVAEPITDDVGMAEPDSTATDDTNTVSVVGTEDVESPEELLSPDEDAVADLDPAAAGSEDPASTDTNETPAGAANDEADVATGPREIELLISENEFRTEGPDGALRVSYDDIDLLKVLNMDPVPRTAPSYFPDWLNGLGSQRIRIRGFMYPPPIESGIPAFLLARDNQICCFGRNPMPYDIVPVILRDDVTTDYINGRPFDVAGVFHIGVEMDLDDPTRVKTVYYIDDAIVIDD